MTPTSAGSHWQHNPNNGAYRVVEVRWWDYTGAAADSTATNPKDAPPGLLWALPGSASWWTVGQDEGMAGWVWSDEALNPDEVDDKIQSAEESMMESLSQ